MLWSSSDIQWRCPAGSTGKKTFTFRCWAGNISLFICDTFDVSKWRGVPKNQRKMLHFLLAPMRDIHEKTLLQLLGKSRKVRVHKAMGNNNNFLFFWDTTTLGCFLTLAYWPTTQKSRDLFNLSDWNSQDHCNEEHNELGFDHANWNIPDQ